MVFGARMNAKKIFYPFTITSINSSYEYVWNRDFYFAGERHDFWEMVYVLRGEVEAVEDEKVYVMHAGNLICHAPMEFHRIRSSGGTEPHVLILSFSHEGEIPPSLGDGLFSLSPDEAATYTTLFARLNRFCRDEQASAASGAEPALSLAAFLSRLSAEHVPENKLLHSGRAAEYRRVIEVMQGAVRENLSLSGIATRAMVSISTVKSLFAAFSGVSPKSYYAGLRAKEAMRCLESGMSVSEVADLLGFSSPNYFSLFFKRSFGVPPGRCKR